MKVELLGSFDANKDMMKVKGDKSGRVWFDTDAQQYPQLARLGLIPENTLFRVTIETVENKVIGKRS